MNKPGCFGSVLSHSVERVSCGLCEYFDQCATRCDEVREELNTRWGLESKIASVESEISTGLIETGPMKDIATIWKENPGLTNHDKLLMLVSRCPSKYGRERIVKWWGLGFDLQAIRRGENPFKPDVEPLGWIAAEELLNGEIITKSDLSAAIMDHTSIGGATALASTNMIIKILSAASVIFVVGNELRLRRVKE